MSKKRNKQTSGTKGFERNWASRPEAVFNHWTKGIPENQIQLAFRRHWILFQELLAQNKAGKCLEVGCGRGTISSYFASAGYDCTLLDYSSSAVNLAKKIFSTSGLKGRFVQGDANALPFKDNSFDVVVSIGLLEHFENVRKPLREMIRVLKPGGRCLAYVVPERTDNIQIYFRPVNRLLALIAEFSGFKKSAAPKVAVYRSDADSGRYLEILKKEKVSHLETFGMYPLPMISHSPEFPFSLLPAPLEKGLSGIFETILKIRGTITGKNPWACDEKWGQAFLVTFEKIR